MYPWDRGTGLSPASFISPCWAPRWAGSLVDEYNNLTMSPTKTDKDTMDKQIENELDQRKCNNWPRFLVIQDEVKESNTLMKLSPFAISKGITGLASKPVSVKKTSFGLLVEVSEKSHSDNLLRSTVLANVPIKVTAHRTLNSSKGVIRCRELSGMTEEEIAHELRDQSVSTVKRILIQKGQKATDTYILTFQKTELPQSIKVGYLNIRVNPYIPNPLRCYRCQDYGHGANRCTRQERCSRCGQNHVNQNCNEEPSCVHCLQKHETSDRSCKRYLMEKRIQTVKFTERISFPEARKKVEAETVKPLYSATVAKTTKSVGIQSTLTWPKNETSPGILSEEGLEPFFPHHEQRTSKDSGSEQATPDFSQGLIEGLKAGIASNPALGQLVQTLFEILQIKIPIMQLNDKDEASTSNSVKANNAMDNQRNQDAGAKSAPLVPNVHRSTGDLPSATSSEVGPTPPPPSCKFKNSKFPLTPKPINTKEKGTKSAPKIRVAGPNK